MGQLFIIAIRSLFQHRTRTFLLGAAIASVTALLLILTGISVGMRRTMRQSATTLMSGHVNVGGFYKVTAGQAAPVVTEYPKIVEIVRKEVPELEYVTERGRGWAKAISDTASMQVGIAGIDVTKEPHFRDVVKVASGNLEDLTKPGTVMVFEEQARKLGLKVGDRMTISAPTFRGINNTLDVVLVAIGHDIGLLSQFSIFMQGDALRELYQLKSDATGAVQLHLKDVESMKTVQDRLRKAFAAAGYGVLDDDPRAFWEKFEVVNRQDWTGQKLDITNWEDEISFLKWADDALTLLSVAVTIVLIVIICVGIMNIMWISIRERTREIGTLRAIGMQRRRVLMMFLTEGFLMGLLGTGAGALLGLGLSALLNAAKVPVPPGVQFFLMSDRVVLIPTLFWVVFSICFITFCITAISLIPSYLAARMKPITAMHHIG